MYKGDLKISSYRARSMRHSNKSSQLSSHSSSLNLKFSIYLGALLAILLVIALVPSQLFGSMTFSSISSSGRIAGLDWLHTHGKDIVGSQGNAIILRGADFMGFGDRHSEQDYAKMKSWGFNVVRLPIAWQYIEPQPGVFNSSYLKNNVYQDIAWAKNHGIYIILDMHQRGWSQHFTVYRAGQVGIGMPTWLVSGYPDNNTGFQQAIADFWLGKAPNGTTPSPSNPSMQDRYINAWKAVVSLFRNQSAVAAYDIFNEPYRGPFTTSEQAPYLYSFYDNLIPEIRKLDPQHIVMYEHSDTVSSTQARLLTYNNLVFSFHFYRLNTSYDGNSTLLKSYFDGYYNNIADWNIPMFVGEFNTHTEFPNPGLYVHDIVSIMDGYNLGWAWWSYYRSDYDSMALCYYNGTERTVFTQYLKNP